MIYNIRTKGVQIMKRQIFLGIGLLILLLPFINSATPLEAAQDSTVPSSPELNAVVDGDKIVYNVLETKSDTNTQGTSKDDKVL